MQQKKILFVINLAKYFKNTKKKWKKKRKIPKLS